MKTTQGCCQQNIENQVSWFAVFFFSIIGIVAVIAQLDSRLRFETQVSESSKSGIKNARNLANLSSQQAAQVQLIKLESNPQQVELNSSNQSQAQKEDERSYSGKSCSQSGVKPLPSVTQRCEISASF